MALSKQTTAADDAQDFASSAGSVVNTANTGLKAAKTAGKAALKSAKLIVKICAIAGPSAVASFMVVFMLIFLFVAPLNAGIFGNLQSGGSALIQAYKDFEGRNLAVSRYQFMMSWEEMKSELVELWNLTFHYDSLEKRNEIMNAYPEAPISDKDTDPEENPEVAYNQAADGLVNLLDGAFRKGWAQTLSVAKDRAIKTIYPDLTEGSTRKKLVDHFRSELEGETVIVYDPDKAFETEDWKVADDIFEAGTFSASEDIAAPYSQYRFVFPDGTEIIQDEPTLKQDSVVYDINYQGPPEDQPPVYLNAILKLIAMQNCTQYVETRTVEEDGTETITFGVPIQFNGSDDTYPEVEKASVEYQLMKLGNEIGRKGVLNLRELKNIESGRIPEEKKPIFRVAVIIKKPSEKFSPPVMVYRTDYKLSYSEDEDPDKTIIIEGVPYVAQDEVLSHREVYLTVSMTIKYDVVIRSTYDTILQSRITRDYTADQKESFADIIGGTLFKSNMQILRSLYGFSSGTGGADNVVEEAYKYVGEDGGRFWAWYGQGEMPWCALFAGFCLDQCGLLTPDMAFSPSCTDWVHGLIQNGRWIPAPAEPEPGMLIFYFHEDPGYYGHVGIVERVENGMVYSIEGNVNDRVQQVCHSLDDPSIAGYGIVG